MARPKGSKNQDTKDLYEIANRLKVSPFEILLQIAKGDWKSLGYESGFKSCWTSAGIEYEEAIIKVDHRLMAAKEAARYLYPQRKAIEHVVKDPLEDMTEEQQLEAYENAAEALRKKLHK